MTFWNQFLASSKSFGMRFCFVKWFVSCLFLNLRSILILFFIFLISTITNNHKHKMTKYLRNFSISSSSNTFSEFDNLNLWSKSWPNWSQFKSNNSSCFLLNSCLARNKQTNRKKRNRAKKVKHKPPITIMDFGTDWSSSAPVEEMIFFSSI